MDEVLTKGWLAGILLAIVGVLMVRLLGVIDGNTKAVGDLRAAVQSLGVLLSAQKEHIERVQEDCQKRVDDLWKEVALLRSANVELVNKVQTFMSKTELLELKRAGKRQGFFPVEGG